MTVQAEEENKKEDTAAVAALEGEDEVLIVTGAQHLKTHLNLITAETERLRDQLKDLPKILIEIRSHHAKELGQLRDQLNEVRARVIDLGGCNLITWIALLVTFVILLATTASRLAVVEQRQINILHGLEVLMDVTNMQGKCLVKSWW
jgi:hypothetical protein